MTATYFLRQLEADLTPQYDSAEAAAIARVVLDHLQRCHAAPMDQTIEWTGTTIDQATSICLELMRGKPVQYVLKEAWFDNSLFYVDPSVLIPRPETEELLDWIKKDHPNRNTIQQVLEIGTGSGILSIGIKRAFPLAAITAIDLSPDALTVAKQNASRQNTLIDFRQQDFLDDSQWAHLPDCDILVSNPPYIAKDEEASMPRQVTNYEPELALFVPTGDPLLFYRAIGRFGLKKLVPSGSIYVEIHESRGEETAALFTSLEYEVTLRTDMQGKQRMIRARKKR